MGTDIRKLQSVHFVGIKGVAMTALAIYCKEKGMRVTGSDVDDDFPTKESLSKIGITPFSGFSRSHIRGIEKPDLVIYTGAHDGVHNEEVAEALSLGIEAMPHGRALGFFMDDSIQISVAGSHGKTTTAAMIACMFSQTGGDPSYAVGCGQIRGLGLPGHFGIGREFIAEADEYVTDPTSDRTPRFLWQHPEILAVTNVDFDHPDAYASLKEVQNACKELQKQQRGEAVTVINADDPQSRPLSESKKNTIISCGFSKTADYAIDRIEYRSGKTLFHFRHHGRDMGEFALQLPGKHNVLNALQAIAVLRERDVSWDCIREGLSKFGGAKRRFEHVGTIGSIQIYDDYAHHPHEIRATLSGFRDWFPDARIITVFQPHTYSRTQALLSEFASSFKQSDVVLIPDVYASAREKSGGDVNSVVLVQAISREQSNVAYVKDMDGTMQYLKRHSKPKDIIVFMGAGDIYDWSRYAVQTLSA